MSYQVIARKYRPQHFSEVVGQQHVTQTLAHAVQVLKANSSRWMRQRVPTFAWQQGYGAFSVSASVANTVKKYIENQAEHHKRRSFEDEFLALLKKSGVPYDPKFVFG